MRDCGSEILKKKPSISPQNTSIVQRTAKDYLRAGAHKRFDNQVQGRSRPLGDLTEEKVIDYNRWIERMVAENQLRRVSEQHVGISYRTVPFIAIRMVANWLK